MYIILVCIDVLIIKYSSDPFVKKRKFFKNFYLYNLAVNRARICTEVTSWVFLISYGPVRLRAPANQLVRFKCVLPLYSRGSAPCSSTVNVNSELKTAQ